MIGIKDLDEWFLELRRGLTYAHQERTKLTVKQ